MWRVGGKPEGDGGHLVEIYKRRGLKVNAGKCKVMAFKWGGEIGM